MKCTVVRVFTFHTDKQMSIRSHARHVCTTDRDTATDIVKQEPHMLY